MNSRQCFGYVQSRQNQNNPALVQPSRQLSTLNTIQYMPSKMAYTHNKLSGEGFADTFHKVMEKGKKLVGKAEELYTGEIGTALRNMIPDSDNTARPGFSGEKHAILKLANGKNGVANYMGPGTQVLKRIKRGDPGRTFSDKVAKRHDIDYAFAGTESTKEKQLKAIRDADTRMISTLSKNKDKDSSRNINMGLQLIRAKKMGEDLGLLSKSKFAGELTKMSDADKMLMMNARRQTTQDGFGVSLAGGTMMSVGSGVMLPGEKLKKKLIKEELNKKRRSVNLLASVAGSGMKKGKGFNPAGMGAMDSIRKIGLDLAKAELPKVLSKIGIKIPESVLSKIIETTMSMGKGDLKDKVKLLAHNLLPLLAVKKTIALSKQAGSGLKLAGQGLNISGRGLSDIMAYMPKSLIKTLGALLLDFFTSKLKGKGLKGKGFWSDFAKGFKMVFKPGAKILGAVATALGQPELGVPLSAVSEIM